MAMITGQQMTLLLKFMQGVGKTHGGRQITIKEALKVAKLTKQPVGWFFKMMREIVR